MSIQEPLNADGPAALSVETISSFNALRAAGRAWDALCARDPEATVFLSPLWLAPVLAQRPGEWLAIAVWEGKALVGLLPLWRRAYRHRDSGSRRVELEAAGRMIWSHYTGLLCDPDHEPAVLDAIATTLMQMDWTLFILPYVPHTDRLRAFAGCFGPPCAVRFPPMRTKEGNVDRQISPRLGLPGNTKASIDTVLPPKILSALSEARHKFGRSKSLRVEDAAAGGRFEAVLADVVALWQTTSGIDTDKAERRKQVFTEIWERGLLSMPVLYDGDTVLGALINVVDARNGYELSQLAIVSDVTGGVPVSLLLHAHAIRTAVSKGRGIYDFGHGNEPWKYGFGVEDRYTATMAVTRS